MHRFAASNEEHAKLITPRRPKKVVPGFLPAIDMAVMRLMLLRHSKAAAAEPGMPDRDRSLTPRGHGDATNVGNYLTHHALLPTRAIVSTARRTRETWERVLGTFPQPCPADYVDTLYNARPDDILDAIRDVDRSAQTLLVIGHNPGLHEVARLLIASGDVEARERLNEGLPTSGLAIIDFAGNNWDELRRRGGRLERFISPRLIRKETD
jgi:phosphohistidine phosphatase